MESRLSDASIGIEINPTRSTQGARVVRRDLDSIKDGAATVTSSLKLMAGALAGLTAVTGLQSLLRDIATTADNIALMRSRLSGLTNDVRAFEKVAESANKLGVSMESASDSVGRFAVAGKEIGLTTNEVVKLNETVIQLGRIGGASLQEIRGSSLQLAQGLSSGRLAGDELRSVLEGMPLVGREIAKSLGVGIGQLREMGSQGKLTADVVSGALLGAAEEVNEEFQKLPRTMEQFEAVASNAFALFQSELSKTIAAGEGFKAVFQFVTDRLEDAAKNLRALRGDSTLSDMIRDAQDLQASIDIFRQSGTDSDFNPFYTSKLADLRDISIEVTEAFARQRAQQAALDEQTTGTTTPANDNLSASVANFVEKLRLEAEMMGKTELQQRVAANLMRLGADATQELRNEVEGLTVQTYLFGKAQEDEADALEEAIKAEAKFIEQRERRQEDTEELLKATETEIANTLAMAEAYKISAREASVLSKEHKLLAANTNLSSEEIRDLAERSVRAEDAMEQMRASSTYLSDTLSNSFDDIGNAITEAFAKGEIAALDMGNVWKAVVSEMVQSGIALSALNPAKNAMFGTSLPTLSTVAGGSSGFRLPSLGLGLGSIGNGIVTSSFGESIGLSAFDIGVGDLVPTAWGNAFTGGLSAAPYGIIGSILGQVLGLGSGNAMLDTGLGAAGSFLGGAAGSTLIGGAFGGPIGAILGSFASSALGSLFKDEDYPFAKGDVNLGSGGLSFTTDSLDDGDEQGAAQLTQAVVAGLQGFLASSGGTLTGDLNQIATIGYASGRSGALGHGFFAGGAGDFATGADFTNLEDSGLAVALSIRQGILKAIDEGTLEGVSQEFMDAVSTGIRNSATDDAEQLAADIDFSVFYGRILDGIEEPLTAVEQAFQALADQTEAAKEQAERLGLALGPVVEHFAELTAEAAQAVEKDLTRQIRSLNGQGYLNALEDIAAQYSLDSKAAEAAGIGTDQVDKLFGLRISSALSGANDVDRGLVSEVLAQAGLSLPDVTQYELQYKALLDQTTAINDNTEALQVVGLRFRAVADSRLTDSRFTPLDPLARLEESRSQFEDLFALATDGTDDPETRDAIQRLPNIEAAMLEASIAYYGKTGGYLTDFNRGQDALRQIANDNFSVADRQLTELEEANTHLSHLATIIQSLGGSVPGGAAAAASGGGSSSGGGSVSGNVVTLPTGVADSAPNIVQRAQAYLDRYPDLQEAFGPNNIAAAIRHHTEFGSAEGRTFHTGGYPAPGEMFRALPNEIMVHAPTTGQMRVLDPMESAGFRGNDEATTLLRAVLGALDGMRSDTRYSAQANAAGQSQIVSAVSRGSEAERRMASRADREAAA